MAHNRIIFAGALLGAIAGYLYYRYVGCVTGTCRITGNPWNSTAYFGCMGGLAAGIFKKERNHGDKE